MNQELENFKKKEITENEKSLTEVNNLEKWKKNSKNFNYSKRDENHQKECKDVFNEKSDLEDNLVVNLNSVVVKKNNLENESTKVVGSEKKKNLNEPQKRKWKLRKNQIFSIFDSVIAIFVIGPVCIGFWCSLWNLLNLQEERFPAWGNIVIGIFLHIFFSVLKHLLHSKFAENIKTKNIFYRIFTRIIGRIYTYFFGFACITHWRGCWFYYDYFFGQNLGFILLFLGVCLKELIALKSLFNLLAVPLIIVLDTPKYSFKFNTRFKTNSRDWSLYILDCAFSVIIVGTLVVFVWRGVWVLLDIYLFPDNREQSALGSLIIGYTLVSIAFLLQPVMRYTCARLQGFPKLVLADAFILLSFLATVNVWRGIWNLLDLWLIPENQELSCWITHIGCFIFLVLLNCSNSILVRGVYIDAEEDKGKCVVFPCHYLRLLFKVEREKKEARKQNLIVTTKDFSSHTEPNVKESENGALLNSVVTPMIISGNQDV